jgi:hypothetical protein
MGSTDVSLLKKLSEQIDKVYIVRDKILTENIKHKEITGAIRENIFSSNIRAKLTPENWDKIFSSDSLEKNLSQLTFSDDILNYLLDYPHVEAVTVEEWAILERCDLYMKEYLEQDGESMDSRWFLPIFLQAMKTKGDVVSNLNEIIFNFQRNALPDRYGRELMNHFITMKALSLVTEHQVPYLLFKTITDIYENDESYHDFHKVCSLLISFPNSITSPYDLHSFNSGVRRVSKQLTDEKMSHLNEKLGSNFVSTMVDIGREVKIDLNEKAINHLMHKEGDTIDILFHPYGDIVRTIPKQAHSISMNNYSYRYSEIFTLKIEKFVQHLALNKKKAFLRLLEETHFNLTHVNHDSLLIDERFYTVVNINTLNSESLQRLAKERINKNHFDTFEGRMTYQEFEFLNNAEKLHVDIFNLLSDIKVDEKLRLLKMLPIMEYKSKYLVSYEEFQILLVNAMKSKKFREYLDYSKNHGFSKKHSLFFHLFKDTWKEVVEEIKTDQEIDLLMSYERKDGESLLEMKERLYKDLPILKSFKEFLNASESFITNNKNNFYRFYEQGLMDAVMKYKSDVGENQKTNLRLLAKAEIADKLRDVKFRDEDFPKEIGITPSYRVREGWKKDLSISNKKFDIVESNDFYDLFNIGVLPTYTCQSWKSGSYRQCLLSIFDLNKKIILVKRGDKVIARAIIRLTKTTENINNLSGFGFIDVEKTNTDNSSTDNIFGGEKIVIFLERFYTSYTGKDRKEMIQGVLSLVEEKAKDMDVEVFYANEYASEKENTKRVNAPIFISRSKNGNQYLDSLGGEAKEQEGGKYHSAQVLRIK